MKSTNRCIQKINFFENVTIIFFAIPKLKLPISKNILPHEQYVRVGTICPKRKYVSI